MTEPEPRQRVAGPGWGAVAGLPSRCIGVRLIASAEPAAGAGERVPELLPAAPCVHLWPIPWGG